MTACNKQPPEGHPFHGTLVACPWNEHHDGECAWAVEPSPARRAFDRLLVLYPNVDLVNVDPQLPTRTLVSLADGTTELWPADSPAGPWLIVEFVGQTKFAILKSTGDIYRMDPFGAVEDEPIIRADTVYPHERPVSGD